MSVSFKLLVLFVGVPLLELAFLIWMGSVIGFWYTMVLVVATGVLGALLMRLEGWSVVRRIRLELVQGRMPVCRLLDGLLVLVGGIMLLAPGFLTDLLGLAFLLPFTRKAFESFLQCRCERMINAGRVEVMMLLD